MSSRIGRRRHKRIGLGLMGVALLLLSGCAFFRASYQPNSTPADYEERMSGYARIVEQDRWIHIEPRRDRRDEPAPNDGVVFYPGAKVSPQAYIPLFDRIVQEGYSVFIVKMPLDLAVMDVDRALQVIESVGDADGAAARSRIDTWHIVGHSLGGAMAAQLVDREPDTFASLTLLAAYPAGGVDLRDQKIAVLSAYGTRDGVADPQEIRAAAAQYPEDARFLAIAGGNHAQFGVYGPQEDDKPATIRGEEQRRITQNAMMETMGL